MPGGDDFIRQPHPIMLGAKEKKEGSDKKESSESSEKASETTKESQESSKGESFKVGEYISQRKEDKSAESSSSESQIPESLKTIPKLKLEEPSEPGKPRTFSVNRLVDQENVG